MILSYDLRFKWERGSRSHDWSDDKPCRFCRIFFTKKVYCLLTLYWLLHYSTCLHLPSAPVSWQFVVGHLLSLRTIMMPLIYLGALAPSLTVQSHPRQARSVTTAAGKCWSLKFWWDFCHLSLSAAFRLLHPLLRLFSFGCLLFHGPSPACAILCQ